MFFVVQWCLPMNSACWSWATILTYGMRQHSTWSSPANFWQRKGWEMNLIIVKFNVHFCLKALKYFSNKAKLQLKQSHKSVFLSLPLRTWITQSCSVMRQLTSMNVPSGLFWKRTCFYTLLLLTMRRWGSITNSAHSVTQTERGTLAYRHISFSAVLESHEVRKGPQHL